MIPTFRFFVNVRHNLMPYIWQEAQYAAQTGQPMMRALALWERDASPYSYFFGRDLLVCPVVEEGATTWPVLSAGGGMVRFVDARTLRRKTNRAGVGSVGSYPGVCAGGRGDSGRLGREPAPWGRSTPNFIRECPFEI